MNKFSLTFNDKNIEKNYRDESYKKKRISLIAIWTILLIFVLIFSIYFFIKEKNYQNFYSKNSLFFPFFILLILSLIILLFLITIKSYNKIFIFLGIFTRIFFYFLSSYIALILENKISVYFLAISVKLLLSNIFNIQKWFNVIVVKIGMIISSFILFDVNQSNETLIIFIVMIVCFILDILNSFFKEKNSKNNYLNKFCTKENANTLKELLFEIYPGYVGIINAENLTDLELNKKKIEDPEGFQSIFQYENYNEQAVEKYEIDSLKKLYNFMNTTIVNIKNPIICDENLIIIGKDESIQQLKENEKEVAPTSLFYYFFKYINSFDFKTPTTNSNKKYKISFTGKCNIRNKINIFENEYKEINISGTIIYYIWNNTTPNFLILFEDIS